MSTHDDDAVISLARSARVAATNVAALPGSVKNAVLIGLADAITRSHAVILDASAADVRAATQAGLPPAKLARLGLTEASLHQLCEGVLQIAGMPDPVGAETASRTVPSGLLVRRVRCPLGVIAMIYEARPGVTIDAFALCFKAGNACILKGGRESAGASRVLAQIATSVLQDHGCPAAAITQVPELSREGLKALLKLDQYIDLVIPRGGTELIKFVREHSKIPTVQHAQGVNHLFVDATADLEMAVRVCVSAKASAPATCNSAECVLVHQSIANAFLPAFAAACADRGVEIRACERSLPMCQGAIPAGDDDWGREYLELVVAVRVVESIDAAIEHIHRDSSNHTEAILTGSDSAALAFTSRVQSSCTLVNASTRFNDGFQLGLGAEIGISTSRVHAYGPMGLEELTTQRYVVVGTGQTR